MALIAHQLDYKMHVLHPRCDLYEAWQGQRPTEQPIEAVSESSDKRMDFHFNALLDIITEWKRAERINGPDSSLGGNI